MTEEIRQNRIAQCIDEICRWGDCNSQLLQRKSNITIDLPTGKQCTKYLIFHDKEKGLCLKLYVIRSRCLCGESLKTSVAGQVLVYQWPEIKAAIKQGGNK